MFTYLLTYLFTSSSSSSSSSSSFERGSVSSGQSGGLDRGRGLQKVLHVAPTAVLAALLHGATATFLLL